MKDYFGRFLAMVTSGVLGDQADTFWRFWILGLRNPLRDHTLMHEPATLDMIVNAAKVAENMINLNHRMAEGPSHA